MKVREGGNYLEDNSFENEFFDGWGGESEEVMVPMQVSYLNDDIKCFSNGHLLMVLMGVLLFLSNLLLKNISNRLMKFLPSWKVFACKFGNSDLLYDVILMVILITKTLGFIYFKEDYTVIRVIFLIYFGLLMFGYSVIFKLKPYYNFYQHRLKCIQVLYLLNLTGFSILVRETNFPLIQSEISTIIFMLLSMTILLKLNENLSRFDVQDLIKKTKESKYFETRELLNIYYLISKYIKNCIESETKGFLSGDSQHDDIAFLINYLLKAHKKDCKKLHCFCKKSKIVLKSSNMSYYKEKFTDTLIFEGLMLLDEMLGKAILNKFTRNDCVFYCYINYLSVYMGRPTLAFKLIKEKAEEDSIMKNKGKGKFYSIELNSLLFSLKHIALKNLASGKLSLIGLERQIGDYTRKASRMRIIGHVRFLNKFEEMKEIIEKCSKNKLDLLQNLRDNGILKKSYKFGVAFYKNKKEVYKDYDLLLENSEKKYSPLMLIFGYFVLNYCQDRGLAAKILSSYTKIMVTNCNLNRIFSDLMLRDFEFSVIYVSSEPELFHKIVYSSSNLFRWLGKPFLNF
jgi:hypothetical protein